MAAHGQLRLLLWKDYLIRKRKLVTLAGIIWATLVMLSLYVVRMNVDNQDFPTCQFPARALPSAGMLTFLQSFVCSVNNECSPMDQFQELPTYEDAKLTQIQRKVSPLIYNETVLEVASSVPDALKLLATIADILDQPDLIDISKKGLKVRDLFRDPLRVKRYIIKEMHLSEAAATTIMASELSIQGVFKGINRCNIQSMSNLIKVEDEKVMRAFVEHLCQLSDKQIQKMTMDVLLDIDFTKYINMLGNMYYKLSGDDRIKTLADLITAVLHMTNLDSYLPPVVTALFQGRHVDFSYFNVTLLSKFVDKFEPEFGNTQTYKIFRDIIDTLATGIGYLDKFTSKFNDPVEETTGLVLGQIGNKLDGSFGVKDIAKTFDDIIDKFSKATANDSIDVFKILSQITIVITKFLPDDTKHDVLLYSTLLAKLIEGTNHLVTINWNIQEMAYDVSLRNPQGVKILVNMPLHIVKKGYESLADAERIQILTSKLNIRGQIFCDSNKLANFFRVSKKEAEDLKKQLCTDAWKNYVGDLIKSFGIYDVRDLINNMASIVFQETIGRDTSDQLYTIEKDFEILKNFSDTVIKAKSRKKQVLNWNKVFNVSEDSELLKVFEERADLGKQILITVHGALAKEVVKQNTLLEIKISPILLDFTTIAQAINDQLSLAPKELTSKLKTFYPVIVQTMLYTLKDEVKTYKVLSTPSEDIVCYGIDTANTYLNFPSVNDMEALLYALCDASRAIDAGLKNDSAIAKAITKVSTSKHMALEQVNWTKLINELKKLYIKLDEEYPYLFDFSSYGMNENLQREVGNMLEEARQCWFDLKKLDKGLHLSSKLVFRLLDLMDSEALNITSEGWLKTKLAFNSIQKPLGVVHDFIRLLTAAAQNETYTSDLPPVTSKALSTIVSNMPQLIVDVVDTITGEDIDITSIISMMNAEPAWPCGTSSVSELLPVNAASVSAIRAAEKIMCMDKSLQVEWLDFIRDKKLALYNSTNWNITVFEAHEFLKFSATFDALIDDFVVIKELSNDIFNESIPEDGRITLLSAFTYAAESFKAPNGNATLINLLSNIDAILNNISTPVETKSLNILWEQLMNCSKDSYIEGECKDIWRAVWKYSLGAVSVVVENLATDLLTYFHEVNELDSNFLQLMGFTKQTGLYILYDKLPEFVGTLLNSFWDYGFMSQVRRASVTDFWDCEAVIGALSPPPGSSIDTDTISKVQPFICPSILHWLSMPIGDNLFLDIVARPQHTFFTQPVHEIRSSYENAFTKVTDLTELIMKLNNKNETTEQLENNNMNSLQDKLKETVDTILNYKINDTNPSYRMFHEINKKQFIYVAYLTRITAMVNKIAFAIDNLKVEDIRSDLTDEEIKKLKSEVSTISRIFKRRPNEAIAFHFDVITYELFGNSANFSLVDGLKVICNDMKNNDYSKDILNENQRTKNQICAKDYKAVYGAVQNVIYEDYKHLKTSLFNLINVLQSDASEVDDIVKFFNDRKKLLNSMKSSVKYAYDLSLPIYLKYLQSNLQNYNVVLSFLSGDDWWTEMRKLYNGPHVSKFFDGAEKSFDIAEDILTKLDKIHLVRLLREVNLNNTESFCNPNITLGDYMPDSTGVLSDMKQTICSSDKSQVFKEIPALVIASQGYDDQLTLSKDIDYDAVHIDITSIESKLLDIKDGPKMPKRPQWITDEKVSHLREVALRLLSKETLTKVAFGVLINFVDAGTLFLNSSQCVLCSQLTTWVKQINLQLYKKQEYDTLLCHLKTLTLNDIHLALKNDFHWDMAFREIISSRNYTKYELNKSLNEMLEQIKLHLLEDVTTNSTKIAECLAKNVTNNALGQTALLLSVLTETTKLIRAELPHLKEVDGIYEVKFFKDLKAQIAPKMDVYKSLKTYLKDKNSLNEDLRKISLDNAFVKVIENADINLRLVNRHSAYEMDRFIKLNNHTWNVECLMHDCDQIARVISENLNKTLMEKDLPKLQEKTFWELKFVTDILYHAENLMRHIGRLVGTASKMDLVGVMEGRLTSLIDFGLEILTDDSVSSVLYSISGILEEISPLVNNTPIDHDLHAISNGLMALHYYKTYLQKSDIKVVLREVFLPHQLESSLGRLGINNTNFWSIAAPRIHLGYILLTPVLSWKSGDHISNYACQVESMSKVIFPSNLDVVTRDDVLSATVEQFCSLSDDRAKQIIPALVEGLNFTYLMDKVATVLLNQLYIASNLTHMEGKKVTHSLPLMASVLPSIQKPVEDVAESLAKEPLLQALKNFSSVGGLLGSSNIMATAGKMLCGKPFAADVPRLYRSVLKNEDGARGPDRGQLRLLPTDFCRSLYKDIISIEGGKIVWSFVKPLVLGKILYTPQTPEVQKIIQQANSTFAHMAQLAQLVHSFADSFSSVDTLSSHREGLQVMRRLLSSPAFEDIRTTLLGDGELPDVDVDGMFDDFGDLQGVGSILSKASSLLRCINLNRFRGVKDEEELSQAAGQLAIDNELSAGIVFLNSDLLNVEYKIRMDIDNVPTTARLKNYLWVPGPEASFLENMRYFRGFIQLQDLVDTAIIKLASNTDQGRHKTTTADDVKWAMYTQQIPYPCYRKDFFQTSLYESQALLVTLFFSLLFTVASVVRFLVADKESGNTMLLGVMGVSPWKCTVSWAAWSALELAATAAAMAAVLAAGRVLPRADLGLLLALLLVFSLAVLSFCYMMSKLFSGASFAAVCSAMGYLVTFMPFVVLLSLEAVLSKGCKLLVCLFMSSSLCYAFMHISRAEATGTGTGWAHIWYAADDDDVSIALAALMMIVDAAVYFAIGWTIDRFYGLKTLQSSITECISTEEKAGVSIVGVSKVYHQGTRWEKVALDNVSIELHQGQITTLLGHNGAGKTTLINIVTGMLKPSAGHVVVRGAGRGARGVCPQHDVLYPQLTAREHILLYARLSRTTNLDDHVDSMISVLSLGHVVDVPVCKLSGGTRRRVCVALAFVGRPRLVTVDEPTAGVDPSARRDIWSMLMKLRRECTILLCTHHLDEAELLSDQLVIMHKGQVHTSGSPVEIKRTLGQGYTLSALYPSPSYDDDEWAVEERAKQLLAAVRQVVHNAALADISGQEVEVTLPFYDEHGLNNNFLELCTRLEAKQPELGFNQYWMDCSSLEHVLYNICQRADETSLPRHHVNEDIQELPSKSASTSSVRTDDALVDGEGPLTGTAWAQLRALLWARWLHYRRDRWLMFSLVVLPGLFVCLALSFSLVRPPADNERPLPLHPARTPDTLFLTTHPSVYSKDVDPSFAKAVMRTLLENTNARNWTEQDTPSCVCGESKQKCQYSSNITSLPEMMVLPDVDTLNQWLVNSQETYIEKRYGGFTSVLKDNITYVVSWYNNKGHHAMPSFVSAANTAVLRVLSGDSAANITTYSHPMKISEEQISKDTVYQHVADAGIAGLVLVAYCLVAAGGSLYLVGARIRQERRLILLSGTSPTVYCAAALLGDLIIIIINIVITAILMEAFQFPVFVARNNLPAICLLILLYGYAGGALTLVLERVCSEPSVANMLLFCGHAFAGLAGLTVLLIMDIVSESEATDNARWALHKVFLLAPPFALGDGLLEIAKNTIQAQVLSRFGMETYQDPLGSNLVLAHYVYLVAVGSALFLLNLAIDYQCFEFILVKFRSSAVPPSSDGAEADVAEEARRVDDALALGSEAPLTLRTIGNINAGFVDTEGKKSPVRTSAPGSDVAACVALAKLYPPRTVALRPLTLGLPPGQCTALLGENGAGKSTLFSMLTGQIRPTTGTIYVQGQRVSRTQLTNGLISYCPQSDAVDPLLTVRETLQLYCRLRGLYCHDEVISRTLAAFGLRRHGDVRCGALSGGSRRKLCAALAFMGRAALLLLDEPTSGMDPAARACVARAVRAVRAVRGASVRRRALLLATHELRAARALAPRVALLRAGALLTVAPAHRALARCGGGHVVECRVSPGTARAVWATLRARVPAARLTGLHHAALHAVLPATHTVCDKEVTIRLSDVFRLMAELQAAGHVDDYTVSQTSLEQIFLSFSGKNVEDDMVELEPMPTLTDADQNSVTAL